jgi:hypothetical protein
MDIRRDETQHQLEIGLHEVENDLVVVVVVTHLGRTRAGTGSLRDKRLILDTPSVLTKEGATSLFGSCLLGVELESDENSEASDIYLIIRDRSVSVGGLIVEQGGRC